MLLDVRLPAGVHVGVPSPIIWQWHMLQGRRLGRGIGSSKGKTAGRGHKGQKARTGASAILKHADKQAAVHHVVHHVSQ